MADGKDPTSIQAPGLLEADGHDLPISPARPAIHHKLREVLDSSPVSPAHALVRVCVGEFDTFCPIYPRNGPRRTYYGATLMALFNISPFINFLEEAHKTKAFNDPLIEGLYGLSQSFRGWQENEVTEEQQREGLESRRSAVWHLTHTQRAGQPKAFAGANGGQPVLEFIRYLFERIEQAELRQGQGGGDDVDLSIRFKQLFKFFNVRHSPMRCSCRQPVLRRQNTKDAQPTGYYLNTEVPKSMNLDQAISKAMWEKLARWRICPECNIKTEPVHDFDKFAYLPEVLFIHAHFIDKSDPSLYKRTTDEKLTYPERLDLSAFRDDPTRPGDQTDCIYKLQSVIHTKHPKKGSIMGVPDLTSNGPEFKAALRLSETEFAQFQYTGAADSYPEYVTFEEINKKSNGVPHLLMYVRERHAEAAGNDADTVEPKPTNPQVGKKEVPRTTTDTSHTSEDGTDSFDLQRFVNAQQKAEGGFSRYRSAEADLERGRKSGRWMLYMFPVVPDVSKSRESMEHTSLSGLDMMEDDYTIHSLAEARAYWNHPLLRDHYHELVQIVLNGPESDIDLLFGTSENVEHFLASLTLFLLVCRNDRENHELFEDVFTRFGRHLHEGSVYQVLRWYRDEDSEEVSEIIEYIHGPNDEQETTEHAPVSSSATATGTGPTTPSTLDDKNGAQSENSATTRRSGSTDTGGYGDGPRTSANHDSAQRIGFKLLSLADQEFPELVGFDEDELLKWVSAARNLGRKILGFGVPEGTAAPVSTPETEARAQRLGLHLMSFFGDDDAPSSDNVRKTSTVSQSVGGFGFDGSADEPGDGADLDDDLFKAVAIPTDPRDPRIEACQIWTLEELKREFQKEQLDWRGLRADPEKHRVKFRKHFELERDYSIYHEGRLRQAIEDRGIRMRHGTNKGDKIDKAELVDALTNYDAQKLQGAEYVEGDESEDTESIGYESEPYQSSEASGTEAKYVARERAALAASRKAATPAQPPVVATAARAQKRSRDEDDDYEEEDDYDDDELMPPTKSPVRMRTRY